jgi:hypothetical protein
MASQSVTLKNACNELAGKLRAEKDSAKSRRVLRKAEKQNERTRCRDTRRGDPEPRRPLTPEATQSIVARI